MLLIYNNPKGDVQRFRYYTEVTLRDAKKENNATIFLVSVIFYTS